MSVWINRSRRTLGYETWTDSSESRCHDVLISDCRIHPENWTKYSLASVNDSDMSDGANTAAALSYLRQQERRSQGQALWDEDAQLLDLRAKVMFHGKKRTERLRPKFLSDGVSGVSSSQNAQANEAAAARPNFGNEVRTLVENRANDHREIALSHLRDEDDDDAMKVDGNTHPTSTADDSVFEEESSGSGREGQPRPKKFKRTMRPRSGSERRDEDLDGAGDEAS